MSASGAVPVAPRVLVVDDNHELRDNLAEILEGSGYAPVSAGTCQGARERAREGGFDVALVDLRLPDGEGTDLARDLKELVPEGEVVLLTGYATVETAAAAVRAGAFAYLVKPCAVPELLLSIEQAMRQRRLHAEKRELRRRAQVTEKLAAVGTLTAGLSHEIKNPLNAAALQLSVLERRVRKLEPVHQQGPLLEPLLLVRDEIRRLDHILQDFLQFARPRELRLTPVALGPVVERVRDFLAAQAEPRGVRVTVEVPEGFLVRSDEDALRQVLINLTLNALDVTPQGGRVSLRAEGAPGGEALVHVDDSGPGVPVEMRERLFEPFFTTKSTGTGLGLPIVHAIVTQHGGGIRVETSPEGGARFTVRLPRA